MAPASPSPHVMTIRHFHLCFDRSDGWLCPPAQKYSSHIFSFSSGKSCVRVCPVCVRGHKIVLHYDFFGLCPWTQLWELNHAKSCVRGHNFLFQPRKDANILALSQFFPYNGKRTTL